MSETIQSYEVPPSGEQIDGLSEAEAQDRIDKLSADSRIEGHPLHLNSVNHPQTKQYVQYRKFLFGIANPDDGLTPLQRIMTEGMKEQEQREIDAQAERVTEAKKDMDILENQFDFIPIDVPDDAPEFRTRSIKEQRLLAEKNINEFQPMMLKDLQDLKAPSDKIEMLSGVMLAYHENRLEEKHIQDAKTLITLVIDENVKKEIKKGNQQNV